MASAALCLAVGLVVFGAAQPRDKLVGKAYVIANRLKVRLSPSASGKITNRLDRGERVDVLEVRNGWARISRFYDGHVEGESGSVARWVAAVYLSKRKPNPARSAGRGGASSSPLERALRSSDDYGRHRSRFLAASRRLISQGRCSVSDFAQMGGWIRSTSKRSTYFTYCGGMRRINRIYLDVTNDRIFR